MAVRKENGPVFRPGCPKIITVRFFYKLDMMYIELLNASRIQLEKVNIAKWLKSLF